MRCLHHPDVVSASCQTCSRPFCPACAHSPTECRECAFASTAQQAHERQVELAAAHGAEAHPLRWQLPAALLLLGALLIAFVAGPPLFPRRVHGAGGAPHGQGRAGYQRCVQHMWELRAGIRAYAIEHGGQPPASLEALPPRLAELACPAHGCPYFYAVQSAEDAPDGVAPAFFLACPDPEQHGVAAIEAGPESLAPVVTP